MAIRPARRTPGVSHPCDRRGGVPVAPARAPKAGCPSSTPRPARTVAVMARVTGLASGIDSARRAMPAR
jgi:hypothetical protein